MVKRTLFALAAALGAAAGWGLGPRESAALDPAVVRFPGVRPGPHVSLLLRGDALAVVFADRDTTSLRALEVPLASPLPSVAPAPSFVDRIDVAPPLGGAFGLHAAAAVDGRLRLVYLDREREDRQLLKSVSADGASWRLSLIEPVGEPVAVLGSGPGGPFDVWAADGLLARGRAGADRRLWPELLPRGTGLPIAPADPGPPDGFSLWDDLGKVLLVVRPDAGGLLQATGVPGAGPVHAAALAPDGTLGVATWDEESRRVVLLQRAPGSTALHRTTVTVCDGTSGLFLAWTPAGWIFVYDEVKPAPLGRWTWELAVLWPGPKAMGRTPYRRGVLSSADVPLAGLRAVVAGGRLFVLELRDALRLLATPLP